MKSMFSKCVAFYFFVYAISLVASDEGARKYTKLNMSTKERRQSILNNLNALSDANDNISFFSIDDEINAIPSVARDSLSWVELRRTRLEVLLRAIDRIDALRNPNFDRSVEATYTKVDPPPETGLSAGASPSMIKDPELRHKYEEAIRQNALELKRISFQTDLRRLERIWGNAINVHIQWQYGSSESEVKEIHALIDTCIRDTLRRDALKKNVTEKMMLQR